MRTLTVITLFLYSAFALAGEGVAKAIIVKGSVNALVDGKKVALKKGMWLPEGSKVQTEAKSFAKLLFIDKSSMNVGPNSEMKIDTFPKKDAGIITLIKGQIRSKVTKNYMDMQKKNKSKLFIKTKTAAMGVRGTDFLVSFNPASNATSLITFEGAVAMAKLSGSVNSQKALERAVSGPAAVMVKRGQFSGTSSAQDNATPPVKISPKQIENLERSDVPGMSDKVSKTKSKKYKSIIPPGVDPEAFANDSAALDTTVSSAVGSKVMLEVKQEVKKENAKAENYGSGTNKREVASVEKPAKRAGGFVDVNSGQYVEPSKDAAFDKVSGTFVVDSNQAVDESGQVITENKSEGRTIASIGESGGLIQSDSATDPVVAPIIPPVLNMPPPPRLDDIIRANGNTKTKATFNIGAP